MAVHVKYPNIDIERTGLKLQSVIKAAGYSVKELQEYLHLSCPQPIYRWFKGKALPSVDHLYAISSLLGMHMEELIVKEQKAIIFEIEEVASNHALARMRLYYEKMCESVA